MERDKLTSRIGRGIAVAGLFLTGCAEATPKSAVTKILNTPYGKIEQISPHTYEVWGNGFWRWEKDYDYPNLLTTIKKTCNIERVINKYTVIVSEPNCIPELK